jgi:predicted metalloprotease with PDZ domain
MNAEWAEEARSPVVLEGQGRDQESTKQTIQVAVREATPAFKLIYRVAMDHPSTHLFDVTLQVERLNLPPAQPLAEQLIGDAWAADAEGVLDLKMPVWTPGSYLVREYARHVQEFAAFGSTDEAENPENPLPWRKISKNHWQVKTDGTSRVTIQYRFFANELSVRTNHLDSTHGYFNGAALFFYVLGAEHCPIHLEVVPPEGTDWQVTTALQSVSEQPNQFWAANFDELVDSPVEVGRHHLYDFEAEGKPHQLAVWGESHLNPERVVADIQRLIEVEADLFGGVPYDRYVFLLHLSAQGFGGLEHKNCCSLIYQRFGFRHPDRYHRFMQLVAHEFFHLWNVKRIRPKGLEVFDYDQENYTPSLWFSEGTTSFYDLIFPYRAGIYDARTYLAALSKEITRFLMTPGRKVQPLSESSFDAWVKLYRQDSNSPNSQMSYYLKGEMVSLLLDLLIRARHHNLRSLDDVMRHLWGTFGQPEVGFTPEELEQCIEGVADLDLGRFFQRCLHSTEELPFDDYLQPFGLRLVADSDDPVPYLGLTLKTELGRELVKFVESGSPAQQAGIDAGDQLLALNGIRVGAEQLGDRLRDFQPGDWVQLAFFHQDELRLTLATLAEPRPTRYQVVPMESPTETQQQLFQGWLKVPLSEIQGKTKD